MDGHTSSNDSWQLNSICKYPVDRQFQMTQQGMGLVPAVPFSGYTENVVSLVFICRFSHLQWFERWEF